MIKVTHASNGVTYIDADSGDMSILIPAVAPMLLLRSDPMRWTFWTGRFSSGEWIYSIQLPTDVITPELEARLALIVMGEG